MENELFFAAGIPPPSSLLDMQTQDYFFTSSSMADSNVHYDSALSSMVSSPVASNSNVFNESFVIRELIGKLGNIGNSPAASYFNGNGGNSGNASCYSTPLDSPPKISLPPLMAKESFSKLPLNSTVAEFSADPGFAERAAKFSCFGSKSFNGRTSMASSELLCRSNSVIGNGKISRVSSSPSIKTSVSPAEKRNSPLRDRAELANSQDESTVSEHKTSGVANSGELNSRKRKSLPKGKSRDFESSPSAKLGEGNEDSNAKRSKPNEGEKNENAAIKVDEDQKGHSKASEEKQTKANQKPPEPPKDYIHVRARRGQATDSHSLAERVRREKISERMKLLQDLVPGCNKVTGKALMLDEIINYVQSLQRQVEFLSMKLASVNTRMDFNMENLVSKDMYQMPQSVFPLDSSAPGFYGHQPQQNPGLTTPVSNGTVTQCSVDPLDTTLCQSFGIEMQLPSLNNGFTEAVPQYPRFCEDDLQSIVQMGFGKNSGPGAGLQSQNFQDSNLPSHMKVEL